MSRILSDRKLSELSHFIEAELALHFPEKRWNDLERNFISAAKDFGYPDLSAFIDFIISSPLTRETAELLASHLTINETYFWREPLTFEALEQKILPELIRQRKGNNKNIRIWSAGCSGGEEPYSIAIALTRIIPDIVDWDISILATDINPIILKKASSGIYSQWSFRGTPHWLKEKYFIEIEDGKYQIIPAIKKMVRFEYLNLAENIYPSVHNHTHAMDIIYCRNVLMYFNQERFRQIVFALNNALVDGGYLVVSASELSVQNFPDFVPVNIPGFVLYQKDSLKKNKPENEEILLEFNPYQVPDEPEIILLDTYTQTVDSENQVNHDEATPIQKESDSEEINKLYLIGNYQEVISRLQHEVLTPEQHLWLIKSYANLGKISDAITSSKKAIETNKLNPHLHYLYATILIDQKQIPEAIASLKKVIYIDSDFIPAYFSLGNILLNQKNTAGAKKYYTNILSILAKYGQDELVPESEGITAGRFIDIIVTTMKTHAL